MPRSSTADAPKGQADTEYERVSVRGPALGFAEGAIDAGFEDGRVRSYRWTLGFDLSADDPLSPHLKGPPRLTDTKGRT